MWKCIKSTETRLDMHSRVPITYKKETIHQNKKKKKENIHQKMFLSPSACGDI